MQYRVPALYCTTGQSTRGYYAACKAKGLGLFTVPSNLFHFLVLQIKKEMSEYWLLSVPGDNTEGQPSWDDLKKKIGSLSNVSKFHIPDLKVGENIARFVMGSSLGHETRDYS